MDFNQATQQKQAYVANIQMAEYVLKEWDAAASMGKIELHGIGIDWYPMGTANDEEAVQKIEISYEDLVGLVMGTKKVVDKD